MPGLNAGIPLTPKKDPVHEATFMAHDFGCVNHGHAPSCISAGCSGHQTSSDACKGRSSDLTLPRLDISRSSSYVSTDRDPSEVRSEPAFSIVLPFSHRISLSAGTSWCLTWYLLARLLHAPRKAAACTSSTACFRRQVSTAPTRNLCKYSVAAKAMAVSVRACAALTCCTHSMAFSIRLSPCCPSAGRHDDHGGPAVR